MSLERSSCDCKGNLDKAGTLDLRTLILLLLGLVALGLIGWAAWRTKQIA
jgi:hypothetical protein